MSKTYVLYNPLSGDGKIKYDLDALEVIIGDEVVFADLTEPGMYGRVLEEMETEDNIILCGGDGTLNRFVNDTAGRNIPNEIFYFPCGTENDFAAEFHACYGSNPFVISEYLKELPTVTVKGKTRRFLNGVGFGIDVFCCQERERLRKISGKNVSNTMIAMQGLLFKYKPTGATVCVDGTEHRFDRVWFAPTMYGKYYGGGMSPAPRQKRGKDSLSVTVFHDRGKLPALMSFPSVCKGTITRHQKYVSVFSGRNITVTFDEPRPLQIDGETVPDVVSYTVQR